MASLRLSTALALLSLAAAQQCTLQFDGRVPGAFSAASFDAQNNIFNPSNVFGQSQSLPDGMMCGPLSNSLTSYRSPAQPGGAAAGRDAVSCKFPSSSFPGLRIFTHTSNSLTPATQFPSR